MTARAARTVTPRQVNRHQHRRARYAEKLAAAQTPSTRLAAEVDFLRAVLSDLPESKAEVAAGEVIRAVRRVVADLAPKEVMSR